MTQKLTQLEIIRRQEDWSYQDLADAIEHETGFHRDQDCWRKICQGTTVKANSRTQHALDLFLAIYTKAQRRKAAV